MRFGFLAHPTSAALRNHAKLIDLVGRLSAEEVHGFSSAWHKEPSVPFFEFSLIRSASGATCEGSIHYLPRTAEEILSDVIGSLHEVRAAVNGLHDFGAEVVGLGGATSIIGGRGTQMAAHGPVPVTSGNSLTAFAALEALKQVLSVLDVSPGSEPVVIIGYPGSIGLVLTRLLLSEGHRVAVVHRATASPDRLLAYLPVEHADRVSLHSDLGRLYADHRIYLSATSSGDVIDAQALQPGSVVIDVALPRDVTSDAGRKDILIVDGGFVSASEKVDLGAAVGGLSPSRQINACVAETIVLALEKRAESFSIGRKLSSEGVLEMGRLSVHHGFTATELTSFGRPVNHDRILRLRRQGSRIAVGSDVGRVTKDRFAEYVNPQMSQFLQTNHIDHVFTRAQGSSLTDTEGRTYLDFVAGYGALNLGHNHPRVIQAVSKHLASAAPTFVQYVSQPVETSALAERLSNISPVGPAVTFFSNSGTEAVEAALKMARVATGISAIGYTINSYHGKTLGALSVTGSARARQVVGPLLPDTHPVQFGDVGALTRLLDERSLCAFIVEPVQGEGGVVLPPEGYLRAVAKACRERGVILIIDEIQTGLGRTGSMFASASEGISPDILCLAKSLSGGVMPIGATICRRELWEEAFGPSERLGLHSSTFGGSNLAAVAALAAIDAIVEEGLPAHATEIGDQLRIGLRKVADRHAFVREVRGAGMMNAVEFDFSFEGGLPVTVEETLRRTPGDLDRLRPLFPDELRRDIASVNRRMEKTLSELLVMRVVAKLSEEHNILTFLSANHNNIMRIQPPLVLTAAEAQRFVTAFAAVCDDLADF